MVEISPALLTNLIHFFIQAKKDNREIFNEKDLNNVIGMLIAPNVKVALDKIEVVDADTLW